MKALLHNQSDSNRPATGVRIALELALTLSGVFILAVAAKAITGGLNTMSGLWLAGGFALGMMLTVPRSRWPWILGATFVAGALSGLYLHANPAYIPWIAGCNTAEVAVAALLMPRDLSRAEQLTRRRDFLHFLGAAVLAAPVVFAALVGIYNIAIGLGLDLKVSQRLFVGHALGFAIMTPVTLALRSHEIVRFTQRRAIVESLLTLAMLVGIATLVFFQNQLPLLFLLFPPMLLVAYRGGFVGTAIALLMVVIIGAVATASGHGPIAAAGLRAGESGDAFIGDGFILLQMVIASLLISLFPIIVSIAEGKRAHMATRELRDRLRLLMAHASNVIILTDLDGRRLYVSPGVKEIFGLEPAEFLPLTWQDYMHPEDILTVGPQILETQRARAMGTHIFRALHATGREIWIEAHVRYFRDPAFGLTQAEKERGERRNCGPGGDEGFVVTLHDVTHQRELELAMERANRELALQLRKDGLTGLANRRYFDEALQVAWTNALEGGWPIAVLMIDVDNFKQFNDCYGHQRGDFCLKDVGRAILSGLFHQDDLAARYGGEEFAVILPNTSTDNAARVAERIRRAVYDLGRPHKVTAHGVLTVSVGVAAAIPVSHGDAMAIVTAADEALYISKREGRNRTTLLDVNWPAAPSTAATG